MTAWSTCQSRQRYTTKGMRSWPPNTTKLAIMVMENRHFGVHSSIPVRKRTSSIKSYLWPDCTSFLNLVKLSYFYKLEQKMYFKWFTFFVANFNKIINFGNTWHGLVHVKKGTCWNFQPLFCSYKHSRLRDVLGIRLAQREPKLINPSQKNTPEAKADRSAQGLWQDSSLNKREEPTLCSFTSAIKSHI